MLELADAVGPPELLKLNDLMFMEASLGLVQFAAASRSSMLIPNPAPGVMLMMPSQRLAISGRNWA